MVSAILKVDFGFLANGRLFNHIADRVAESNTLTLLQSCFFACLLRERPTES